MHMAFFFLEQLINVAHSMVCQIQPDIRFKKCSETYVDYFSNALLHIVQHQNKDLNNVWRVIEIRMSQH
uniref:Putative secreted protein n=1 Tax=Anopheles darlingi TaxID=43151 RepID=A0A2M4DB10_ANODA